jgi:hypothetical protein
VVEETKVEVSEIRGDCWIYSLYLTMIQWFARSGVESPGSLQTLRTQDETRGLPRVWRVFGGMMTGMMMGHGWSWSLQKRGEALVLLQTLHELDWYLSGASLHLRRQLHLLCVSRCLNLMIGVSQGVWQVLVRWRCGGR